MTSNIVLLFIALNLVGKINAFDLPPYSIPKCCPDDSKLIRYPRENRHGFNCTEIVPPSNNETKSDYFIKLFSSRSITNHTVLIPECNSNENHLSIDLSDRTVNVPTAYCVDWFDGRPVAIYCEKSKFHVIKLSKYHKCCEQNYVYNHEINQCLPVANDTSHNGTLFENILRNDFTIYTIGPPKCSNDEVMVIYKSHVHKIELIDLNLKMNGEFMRTFCVDVTDDGNWIAQVCRSKKICKNMPCVQKCCNLGDAVIKEPGKGSFCGKNLGGIGANFYDMTDYEAGQTEVLRKDIKEFGILHPNDCLKSMLYEDEYFIDHEKGHVYFEKDIYKHDEYCMDLVVNRVSNVTSMATFSCLITNNKTKFMYMAAGSVVSCAFLLITILVYLCIPKLCNLHGKTLLGNVISYFVAGCSLAFIQFDIPNLNEYCRFLSFLMYFSYISAFSWLNIMCIDIYLKIRSVAPKPGTNIKSKDLRRFIYYSIYSIGFPILMTTVTLVVDTYKILPKDYLPNMGNTTCWFEHQHKNTGNTIFFLTPIGIQIFVNLVLFILTAIYCNRVKNEIHRRSDAHNEKNEKLKKRYFKDLSKIKLLVKLFVVMGISWSLEIISTIFHDYKYLFYVSDAMNTIHGLFIFIIFVCKKNIWEKIRERCGYAKKRIRPGETTMTTTMTTTSIGSRGSSACLDPHATRYSRLSRNETKSTILSGVSK